MKRLGYLLLLFVIFLLPGLLLINSCKHDGITGDKFKPICYTTEVLPIFGTCAISGCHDGKSGEQRYAYTNLKTIRESVTPYNLKQSKAYQSMISTFNLMPPGNALPIEKRTIIMLWIEQGADSTKCGKVTKSGNLMPSIKRTSLKGMPGASSLSKSEVSDFELWITQGYK